MSAPVNGVYTYTDESGATQTIDTNANSNPYDNTTSGLVATDVQAAIDEINAAAGTVALVDNLDGTYDFTDAAGNTTTITDTSISTMSAPVNGVYTYTDESGATQTIDTNANSNPYDNTTSGLVATDVQAAIDEINAAAGTVALVDNLDGTYDFTDAAGNTTTITDTSISTLVNNGDATFTYTNENGVPITIDLISADANNDIVAGTDGGLYLNVAAVTIAETNTTLGFNGATNELTYTNELGNNPVLDLSSIDTDTDDQTVDGLTFNAGTGELAISLEDDGTAPVTVDLSALDTNTTNTSLTEDGTNLILTDSDTNTVTIPLADIGTDDQTVDGLTFNAGTGELGISLEDDGAAPVTVDLSALDTNTTNTSLTEDGTNLILTDSDTNTVTIPLADIGTDDQTVDGLTFNAGTGELAISLEDDGAAPVTVDLSALDTDDQQVDTFSFNAATGELTLEVQDDGQAAHVADLSALDTNTTNTSLTEDGTNLILTDSDTNTVTIPLADIGTDDQTVDGLTFNAGTGELAISLEDDGTAPVTVDLSALDTNTTNTSLTEDGTNLILTDSDTNTVTIPLADIGTDDQTVDGLTFNAGTGELGISLEDDGAAPVTVDLSALDTNTTNTSLTEDGTNLILTDSDTNTVTIPLADIGTDDQTVDGLTFNAGTGELAISLEDDGAAPVTVDLSALDTDDQQVDTFSFNAATGELTLEVQDDGQAAHVADLSALDTNTTNTSLTEDGTNLILTDSDTNTVTIPLADIGTDDQTVDGLTFNAGTGELAISLEDDGTAPVTVDLSALDTNTTNTSLTEDGTNLILTDSDTNTVTIPLADIGTDDQYDDEVLLRTAIDVDDAEKSVAQGYLEETTVQEVINAIAPITSKAARIFYPPSIAVDASTIVSNVTIDLYQEYIDQFGSPTMASAGAPLAVPTYDKTELYYYVTFADPAVLNIDSIDADGVMQYDVVGTPADYNSLINVVFVVK
jgi:hypothetical protein